MAGFDALLSGNQSLPYAKVIVPHLYAWIYIMKKQEELDNYYISLKRILVENYLMDKPGEIYNVDKSGMPLEHRPPRVLAKKGNGK